MSRHPLKGTRLQLPPVGASVVGDEVEDSGPVDDEDVELEEAHHLLPSHDSRLLGAFIMYCWCFSCHE